MDGFDPPHLLLRQVSLQSKHSAVVEEHPRKQQEVAAGREGAGESGMQQAVKKCGWIVPANAFDEAEAGREQGIVEPCQPY